MSEDEITRETKDAVIAYFEALKNGLCPTCGAKVEEEKQVGRCVYGLPCWHRLFQGKAKKKDDTFKTFRQDALFDAYE